MSRWPFLFLAGCTAAAPAVNHCWDDLQAEILKAGNCTEAQLRTDILLRYDSPCRELFGDASINLCQAKDGGTDGRRD